MNNDQQIAILHPVVVTAETLQILSKQEKYSDLLALYMAYVEVTTWQHDNSVKAATRFMSNRLHWNKDKITRTKKILASLGLVEDVVRKDQQGKVTGHYILVKHVTKPEGGFEGGVDLEGQSANDFHLSANNKSDLTEERKDEIKKIYKLWLIYMIVDPATRLHGTPDERSDALEAATKSYRFTPKRRDAIIRRLDDAGYEMLVRAIRNISKSDFHRGDNDRGWKADLADFLCRSYEQVEKFANQNTEKEGN